MFFLKICTILLVAFLENSGAINYCGSHICNNTQKHTLCLYKSEDPARHCISYEKTIATVKEKQAILDKLNNRRNKVAAGDIRSLSPADRMMKLEWNQELETSAQRWANQCVRHSVPDIKDTCRDLGQMFSGQNIATIYGIAPGLTPLALVDVWYMELLNINASALKRYQPSEIIGYSHYDYFTQLVWAETRHVGCGGVKFKEHDPSGDRNRTIYRLVCNFAPGGNRPDMPVYTEGQPCSRCPDSLCDPVYKSLCYLNSSIDDKSVTTQLTAVGNAMLQTISKPQMSLSDRSRPHGAKEDISNKTDITLEDSYYTPFDYFSHLHEFTRQPIILTTSTQSQVSCKDVMAVEDFVKLLKKKKSSDPLLKELLQSTKSTVQSVQDNVFTDASVAALVNRIYSKKYRTTTTKIPKVDYVNSTLLLDLVEAVIFRGGDKIRTPSETEMITQQMPYGVSPIKIQAELAEVKLNSDFTGHYFFPEDDETGDDNTSDTTESYYDTSNIPVSDVQLEIEYLKRNKATKDFIDEILESDSATESTTTLKLLSPDDLTLYHSGRNSMKKFLEEIGEKHSTHI